MKKKLIILVSILAVGAAGAILYNTQLMSDPAPPLAAQAAGLKRIDNKFVCMVNERAFAKVQIPVQVGDKIYYGCCQNCINTLNNQREARYGKDPVSGNEVDKSTAVIAEKRDGTVVYFESESNFRQYMK